jgi:hypothetical protein
MAYTPAQIAAKKDEIALWEQQHPNAPLPPDLQAFANGYTGADDPDEDATAYRDAARGITNAKREEVAAWLKSDAGREANAQYNHDWQELRSRDLAVRQHGVETNRKNMNFGSAINSATLTDSRKAGNVIGGAITATLGDALGGAIRGLDQGYAAAGAARTARAMQNAQNEHARNDIVAQGDAAAQDMNFAARGTSAQMTDNAIAQANSFESGMQGIGASGIEGSANMERNLQYGQSRADAQEQMQYDMMSDQAGDLSNEMAHSFSNLSQMTQQAGTNALNGSINAADAAYNADWTGNGEYSKRVLPSNDERDKLYFDAEAAMNADPLRVTDGGVGAGGAETAAPMQTAVPAAIQTPQAATPAIQTPQAPAYGWTQRSAGLQGLSADEMKAGEAAYNGGQKSWEAWVKNMNSRTASGNPIGNWMRK